MDRVVSARPLSRPRRRVRDPKVVALYHEIRSGLLCEWCHRAVGTEANHILHGQKKEDAFWNLMVLCHDCHQNPVYGFHGQSPRCSVEGSLRRKLEQGFSLPREAWAYLDGVDSWPGTDLDLGHEVDLAKRIAASEREGRVAYDHRRR